MTDVASAAAEGPAGVPGAGGKPDMVDVFGEDTERAKAAGNPVGAALARLADTDPRVIALSADMSAPLGELRERHPDRYIEMGIAETNTVSVAAGLAACGMVPYVLSMAPFGVLKCAEQLRTDVTYTNLPVRLIGRLSGLAMGFFGTSHHAVEDIAIARTLANFTVVAPADDNAALGLLLSGVDHPGPVFYRISEGTTPVYDKPRTFEYGRWSQVRDGGDVTIIATGLGVGVAVGAAGLLAAGGISAGVLDALYLKPADTAAVRRAAEGSRALLTVEEHSEIGGLGALVAEVLGRERLSVPLASVALPDTDLEVGVPAALYEYYGLTPAGVAARARSLLGA
jgi:transketolase